MAKKFSDFRADINYNETLIRFDESYRKLFEHWEAAKRAVVEHQEMLRVKSYEISLSSSHEVIFSIFGMRCFMDFGFTAKDGGMDTGIILYSVMKKGNTTGTEKKIAVADVEFEPDGNISYPSCLSFDMKDFKKVHAFILSAIIEDLVKMTQPTSMRKDNRALVC